jgi:predicted N-acetyltransferase YhbS
MSQTAFQIKSVASLAELELVYSLAVSILGNMDDSIHTHAYYCDQYRQTPSLLVYAEKDGRVVGCILGSIERDHVLVGPTAVAAEVRGLGVGAALMRHLEEEARKLNQTTLILGSRQEAEGFYLRCGFHPNLFIQLAQPDQLEALKQLNQRYAVIWEMQDAANTRIMLATPQVDRDLQAAYEKQFPGCGTQYVFIKEIALTR